MVSAVGASELGGTAQPCSCSAAEQAAAEAALGAAGFFSFLSCFILRTLLDEDPPICKFGTSSSLGLASVGAAPTSTSTRFLEARADVLAEAEGEAKAGSAVGAAIARKGGEGMPACMHATCLLSTCL